MMTSALKVVGAATAMWALAVVGGSAQMSFAVAPVLVVASVALLLRFRSRSQNGSVSSGEKMAWLLAVSLLPGPVLAAALSEPTFEVASAGASLLAAFGYLVVLGLLPLAAVGFIDARKGVEWFIARRYLVAKRRQTSTIRATSPVLCGNTTAVGFAEWSVRPSHS